MKPVAPVTAAVPFAPPALLGSLDMTPTLAQLTCPFEVRHIAAAVANARIAASMVLLLGVLPACSKPTQASDGAQGKTLFVNNCARCHGAEGTGGLPVFEGGPSPRNFRDHAFHAERTDAQIKMTIVNGKGSGMPPFGTLFDEAQLDALVQHVRSLDPEGKKK